jgi:hypothetical protein
MWFWGRLVEKFDKTLNLWSVTAIITTPVFLVLAMVHPLVSVKLLILVLLAYIGIKYLGKKWWLVLGFLAIFTIGYNFFVLGNRPAILNQFSLKDAQGEVTTRMTEEDSLYTKISLPLWWRRIAYNKFYFIYKNAVGEILPFWDLESVFFQEVHPLDQKSVVMFYWIEMYVFIFGIYFLVKNKNLNLNKFIILGILLSWTDFVFSEGSPY